MESLTFEKKRVESITVTSENIKNPEKLAEFIEMRSGLSTKVSSNRPWIYIKNPITLKTLGGVRLNKNSIGTFYIDTALDNPLNESSFGIVSKETKNFISNKITVNSLSSLDKVCEYISSLHEDGKLYSGKRN